MVQMTLLPLHGYEQLSTAPDFLDLAGKPEERPAESWGPRWGHRKLLLRLRLAQVSVTAESDPSLRAGRASRSVPWTSVLVLVG